MAGKGKGESRISTKTAFFSFTNTEHCEYQYTAEPPGEIRNCNPYNEGLNLGCNVTASSDPDYEIRWFHNNSDGVIRQLFNEDTDVSITCGSSTGMLRMDCQIRIQPQQSSDIGHYYCQIHLSNRSALTPSSSFHLMDNEFYVNMAEQEDLCDEFDGSVAPETEKCAEIISSPTPSSSLSIVSPTTQLSPMTTPTESTTASGGTTTDDSNTDASEGSSGLQTWLYVVVAVAAVFAMIIIILAIVCVGLCLRKSQTMDVESLKRKLTDAM